MEEEVFIRPYKMRDETEISRLIAHTLRVSNQKDYSSIYRKSSI